MYMRCIDSYICKTNIFLLPKVTSLGQRREEETEQITQQIKKN